METVIIAGLTMGLLIFVAPPIWAAIMAVLKIIFGDRSYGEAPPMSWKDIGYFAVSGIIFAKENPGLVFVGFIFFLIVGAANG
jgi:hypothetical protein